MVRHAQGMPCTTTETTMTDREARAAANQQKSLEAFLAAKAEFDALIAELQQASADHFGADPEAVLWAEAAWLADAAAKLKQIADQHFHRGEYAE
jgi:indole-3-glycerol phosphate synthase